MKLPKFEPYNEITDLDQLKSHELIGLLSLPEIIQKCITIVTQNEANNQIYNRRLVAYEQLVVLTKLIYGPTSEEALYFRDRFPTSPQEAHVYKLVHAYREAREGYLKKNIGDSLPESRAARRRKKVISFLKTINPTFQTNNAVRLSLEELEHLALKEAILKKLYKIAEEDTNSFLVTRFNRDNCSADCPGWSVNPSNPCCCCGGSLVFVRLDPGCSYDRIGFTFEVEKGASMRDPPS